MVRVLRYPRLFYTVCTLTIFCALLRDRCIGASLEGPSRMLLIVTAVLLLLCLCLMSCRFFVDVRGIGVGFLHRVRLTQWEDITSLGLICCNSRRQYFYGMYHTSSDFLNMLHHAPVCGPWGFVVPVSKKLLSAICSYCPFDLNLSSMPMPKREGKMHFQWHQTALYALIMLPAVVIAFLTAALMLLDAAKSARMVTVVWMTLGALVLLASGIMLLHKLINTLLTCPAFNEQGVCTGAGLYLPWNDVRFGYVHRFRRLSGMFLLSQPLQAVKGRGAPPIQCLSMPDTRTLLIAYLTYCPHASKGIDV